VLIYIALLHETLDNDFKEEDGVENTIAELLSLV